MVQLALSGILFFKLVAAENQQAVALSATPPLQHNDPALTLNTLPALTDSTHRQTTFNGQQIRQIVREEIIAALNNHAMTALDQPIGKQAPVYDDIETQYRRELALLQMETLKSQVEVTSAELNELMADIAKLDPENRIELFQLLNRAMNRGEIKGHL